MSSRRGKQSTSVKDILNQESDSSSGSENGYDAEYESDDMVEGVYQDDYRPNKPNKKKIAPEKNQQSIEAIISSSKARPTKKKTEVQQANIAAAEAELSSVLSNIKNTKKSTEKPSLAKRRGRQTQSAFLQRLQVNQPVHEDAAPYIPEVAPSEPKSESILERRKEEDPEPIKTTSQTATKFEPKVPELIQIDEVENEFPVEYIEAKTDEKYPEPKLSNRKAFNMYLTHVHEEIGYIYLFGKTFIEGTQNQNIYATICVRVTDPYYLLYFLPNTDSTPQDVIDEIKKFKGYVEAHPKRMMYAFGEPGIPDNETWVCAKFKGLNNINMVGKTYTRVFNYTANLTEVFIMQNKVMGPQWVTISNVVKKEYTVSLCCQYDVPDISCIEVADQSKFPHLPSFNIASIATRSYFDEEHKVSQIFLITARIKTNVDIEKFDDYNHTYPKHKKSESTLISFLCNAPGASIPRDFKPDKNVHVHESESDLLDDFLNYLQSFDIDLILNYGFNSFDGQLILQRLVHNKVDGWFRIGRLKRSLPTNINTVKKMDVQRILCGRLPVDVRVSADEFFHSKANDFSSIVQQELGKIRPSFDNSQIGIIFEKYLQSLLNANMNDTVYIIDLVKKIQVLPLTLTIANLSGTTWCRVLLGAASFRAEALFAHNFINRGYVIPDKSREKISAKREEAKFQGGKVLDPMKGFYDRCILLLDFNSLYPSIIIGHNICFTTKKVKENNRKQIGVIPSIMKDLLTKRKDVKKEQEDAYKQDNTKSQAIEELNKQLQEAEEKNDAEAKAKIKAEITERKKEQTIAKNNYRRLNIRQLAIKILANSMYGYLGFKGSRFPAMELAEKVTKKGREALETAKHIVEANDKVIIYGDTDSVMVDSKVSDVNEAFDIASDLTRQVNKALPQLELGIDGVFVKMLLVSKKKYASLIMRSETDVPKLELKGLDMVRRDWSNITRYLSLYVINQFMYVENPDEAKAGAMRELSRIARMLRNNGEDPGTEEEPPLDDSETSNDEEVFKTAKKRLRSITPKMLVISKAITSALDTYKDVNVPPHVLVAKYMRDNLRQSITPGRTIMYIIAAPKESNDAEKPAEKTSAGQRAVYPDLIKEVKDADINYYLESQIYRPIARLCQPFNIMQNEVGAALGLRTQTPSYYGGDNDDDNDYTVIPHTEELTFECPHCKTNNTVTSKLEECLKCRNCAEGFSWQVVANLLNKSIKKYVSDNTNVYLTRENYREFEIRQLPFNKNIIAASKGKLRSKLQVIEFYNNLRYFVKLFEKKKDHPLEGEALALQEYMRIRVDKFAQLHGFNHINLSSEMPSYK